MHLILWHCHFLCKKWNSTNIVLKSIWMVDWKFSVLPQLTFMTNNGWDNNLCSFSNSVKVKLVRVLIKPAITLRVAKTSCTHTLGLTDCLPSSSNSASVKKSQMLAQAGTTCPTIWSSSSIFKQLFMATQGTWVKTWEPDLHMSQMKQDTPWLKNP